MGRCSGEERVGGAPMCGSTGWVGGDVDANYEIAAQLGAFHQKWRLNRVSLTSRINVSRSHHTHVEQGEWPLNTVLAGARVNAMDAGEPVRNLCEESAADTSQRHRGLGAAGSSMPSERSPFILFLNAACLTGRADVVRIVFQTVTGQLDRIRRGRPARARYQATRGLRPYDAHGTGHVSAGVAELVALDGTVVFAVRARTAPGTPSTAGDVR